MAAVADHVELKHLNRRIEESRASLKALREEKKEIEEKISREQNTITRLQAEIERLKRGSAKVVISEHAILRYIERVMKVNLEEIKKKILPEEVEEKIRVVGNGKFPADTHRVKIQNGVVITILTDEEEP